MKTTNITLFMPVIITAFLIAWTLVVSPFSKHGDDWAIIPALLVLPIVVIWHIGLVIVSRPRFPLILFGMLHTLALFVIWMICIMKISKDAL